MPYIPRVHLKKISRSRNGKPARQEWVLRWYTAEGIQRSAKIGDVASMSKREAERTRRLRQADLESRVIPAGRSKRMTLDEFRTYYVAALEGDRKPATIDSYDLALRKLADVLGEKLQIASVAAMDIARFKRHLVKDGASSSTVRTTLITLRCAFNRARKWGLLHENPFADQTMPKPSIKPMRIFSPEEIQAMIMAACSVWWRAFICTAVTTGLRLSEILHLHWSDIEFEEGLIRVTAKRAKRFRDTDGETHSVLEWSPKSHHERAVPAPMLTFDLLHSLRQGSDGSPYVFLNLERLKLINNRPQNGKVRRRMEIMNNTLRDFHAQQRAAARLLDRDDWELGTIHDLRKTYSTNMASVLPMHVLKEYLGHQDISTTARYYTAVGDQYAEVARRALAEAHAKGQRAVAQPVAGLLTGLDSTS